MALVDRDGVTKTALAIIIDEILRAGIETIGVVISPGDAEPYRVAAGKHAERLTFIWNKDRNQKCAFMAILWKWTRLF